MHSSDDDLGGGVPFTIWCMACGHAMHTSAHGNQHRRLCVEVYGFMRGCCGEIFVSRPLTTHLNKPGAYRRVPRHLIPPTPVTDRPNRSCSQLEAERRGRYHPYTRSPASSVSSASGNRHSDPVWSGTAPAVSGAHTTLTSPDTGFGYPASFSPTTLLTDLAVTVSE